MIDSHEGLLLRAGDCGSYSVSGAQPLQSGMALARSLSVRGLGGRGERLVLGGQAHCVVLAPAVLGAVGDAPLERLVG